MDGTELTGTARHIALLALSILAAAFCVGSARANCARPNADASVISEVTPAYPIDARTRGAEGTVVVKVTIGVDGSVTGTSIVTSSGDAALDMAAVAAAKASKYSPKIVNCVPTVSSYGFKASFFANGTDVPLSPITVVPGLIGYARLGIETTRVMQLTDNASQLATPRAQQYVDSTVHDVISVMPDKRTEVTELRKNLIVDAAFSRFTAASSWRTVMGLLATHLQRGTSAAKSFGFGTATAQAIRNAETFHDIRMDALFRGVIAGESVLDADVPGLKDLRNAIKSPAPGDWVHIDILARKIVDALTGRH